MGDLHASFNSPAATSPAAKNSKAFLIKSENSFLLLLFFLNTIHMLQKGHLSF